MQLECIIHEIHFKLCTYWLTTAINATIYYSESPTYSGEIEKVATNIYHLGLDGADIYFGFYTETTGDEKALRMQFVINGREEDWYYRSEEFVS